MNNYSNLIEKYTSKIKKDPNSRVFAPLGEIYRKMGMYDKALSVFESGLEANPDYVFGQIGLAQCLFDVGEFEQSYNILRPSLHTHGDNIKFLTLFALVADKLNYFDEALNAYKNVLFINPKDEEAKEYIKSHEESKELIIKDEPSLFSSVEEETSGWEQVSFVDREEVDNSERPEVLPENPASLKPTNQGPVFSHTLVDLYIKQGANDKAIELLESALESSPGDSEIIDRLNTLRATDETTVGHDALMEAFDRSANLFNQEDETKAKNEFETLKMAFDLFLTSLRSRQKVVLA